MPKKLASLFFVSLIAAGALLIPPQSYAGTPACPPLTCADFINNWCRINNCPLTAVVPQGPCLEGEVERTLYIVACAWCGYTECYGP